MAVTNVRTNPNDVSYGISGSPKTFASQEVAWSPGGKERAMDEKLRELLDRMIKLSDYWDGLANKAHRVQADVCARELRSELRPYIEQLERAQPAAHDVATVKQRISILERIMKLPYIKQQRDTEEGVIRFVARNDVISALHAEQLERAQPAAVAAQGTDAKSLEEAALVAAAFKYGPGEAKAALDALIERTREEFQDEIQDLNERLRIQDGLRERMGKIVELWQAIIGEKLACGNPVGMLQDLVDDVRAALAHPSASEAGEKI